ncbi:DUF4344 domain-containing metallopeptidase [Aeromicrobium halocynthiae]|uniref:DUF4344 domain-containing metallopeptidase n=1 Tax=Aeromicrobium halocynthiae TaxID=560557 RepID=A0ABN2VUJ2_9ACTN
MRARDVLAATAISASALLVAVGAIVALVLLAPGEDRPVFAGEPRFVVTWAEESGEIADEQRAMRRDGAVAGAVADLNRVVELPRHVEVRVRSCDFGTSFDGWDERIDLCVDESASARDELAEAGDPDPDATVLRIWRETVMHEAAHALVQLHDLEHEGSEEDLADSFAAWMLLRDGDVEDVDALVAAALQYDVWAGLYESDTSDGHSTDAVRAANYACWVLGAHPERAEELAPVDSLRVSRVPGCADELRRLERDWESRFELMDAGG